MTDKTPEQRIADLEATVRQLEEENKKLREAHSNPFPRLLQKMLQTFEGYQLELAESSFFLQTTEERKARLAAIIDLCAELVKVREVHEATNVGESIIIAVIEGRWNDVAEVADRDLVFKDNGKLNDLWSWFRSTALAAALQARQRNGGLPLGEQN